MITDVTRALFPSHAIKWPVLMSATPPQCGNSTQTAPHHRNAATQHRLRHITAMWQLNTDCATLIHGSVLSAPVDFLIIVIGWHAIAFRLIAVVSLPMRFAVEKSTDNKFTDQFTIFNNIDWNIICSLLNK